MSEEKLIFSKFLATQGLRETPQRQIVLDVFLSQEQHISAEELYRLVCTKDPSLGQATVYRVLKLICEAGLAHEVDFGDGVLRYEHAFDHRHHDHLICTHCGKAIEVIDPTIESLQQRLAACHGFSLTGHELYLYGICPDCAAQQPQSSPSR